MAKGSMKKSNVKKRSDRAIAMEQERLEQEAKAQAEKERRKRQSKVMGDTVICMFGFCLMIVAWLVDYMGIVALMSIIFCIIGLFHSDRNKEPRDWWCCRIGLILAIVRFVLEMYPVVTYFLG